MSHGVCHLCKFFLLAPDFLLFKTIFTCFLYRLFLPFYLSSFFFLFLLCAISTRANKKLEERIHVDRCQVGRALSAKNRQTARNHWHVVRDTLYPPPPSSFIYFAFLFVCMGGGILVAKVQTVFLGVFSASTIPLFDTDRVRAACSFRKVTISGEPL